MRKSGAGSPVTGRRAGNSARRSAAADRALKLDRKHLGALSTRTQILYATKRYNEALALSQQLVERLPDDPNVLFKHAQIAHEAHAYQREIARWKSSSRWRKPSSVRPPATGSISRNPTWRPSKGKPAIDAFTRVLADPDLPADQRKFARGKSRANQEPHRALACGARFCLSCSRPHDSSTLLFRTADALVAQRGERFFRLAGASLDVLFAQADPGALAA